MKDQVHDNECESLKSLLEYKSTVVRLESALLGEKWLKVKHIDCAVCWATLCDKRGGVELVLSEILGKAKRD